MNYPCTKCGATFKSHWLTGGICNGCRNPHLVVRAVTKEVPMKNQTGLYVSVRLTGRCADGAERDGGRRIHLQPYIEGGIINFAIALCGAKPGRRSNGFVPAEGEPNCPRCLKKIGTV